MSVNKIATVFQKAKQAGRAALIGYLPAGYPDLSTSIQSVTALVEAGCDLVEVGLPYSDPIMDGPIIQTAAKIALDKGFRLTEIFKVVQAVVKAGGCAVVMSYYNPLLQYGIEKFADNLTQVGGSGLIIPDLIPEEADQWIQIAQKYNLAKIFIVSPTSSAKRLQLNAAYSSGFIYATAVMGTTGVRTDNSTLAPKLVAETKKYTKLPVGVGLGISTPTQVQAVTKYADAIIVGSALVSTIAEKSKPKISRTAELIKLVTALKLVTTKS